MECVVNDQYQYIMFYGAKVACTSLRVLYLDIHASEMSKEQLAILDEYHNLNDVCPYDPDADYSNYYKFYISRNPYDRIVSAFLDQFTFAQHTALKAMLIACPPESMPQNFLEFLRYIKTVPDHQRDSHFRTQSHFAYKNIVSATPWWDLYRQFRGLPLDQLSLDYSGDVSQFNDHLERIYRRIFRLSPQKRQAAVSSIHSLERLNRQLYSPEDWDNADQLSCEYLRILPFLPKPQDFYKSDEAKCLVQEIYASDFALFGYDINSVPQKKASPEIADLPDDFDWKIYATLNPDLAGREVVSERALTHHYLVHGRLEERTRFYKLQAPHGFDWEDYLELNPDLPASGIDNERDALIHYLAYGYHENRFPVS